jgi:BolA protein
MNPEQVMPRARNDAPSRLARIESALRQAFPDDLAEVTDMSAQHHGHAGFDAQGSHFHIRLQSRRFAGIGPLARHRLVYDALGPLLLQEVHSFTLELRPL